MLLQVCLSCSFIYTLTMVEAKRLLIYSLRASFLAAVAYEVIKTIKKTARESNGAFSVVLTVHQPDMRMLAEFDHILLLGRGKSNFFGTVGQALQHFGDIGFPVVDDVNPADHFLAVTDTFFADSPGDRAGLSGSKSTVSLDFSRAYASSHYAQQVYSYNIPTHVTCKLDDYFFHDDPYLNTSLLFAG